jgi:hypothetical protein
MSSILIHILTAAILAVPPLTPGQQEQVHSATDGREFDEAALYPLLENATTWQAGDESGAMIPDYAAIRGNPDQFRGQLVLIEGEFAGVPEARGKKGLSVGEFHRNGPWDGRVEQWTIEVTLPKGERDSVVVYLVDPPADTPRAKQRVRLVARFYKVWHEQRAFIDTDVEKQPDEEAERPIEPFLVFIGHSARVVGKAPAGGEPAERALPWVLAIAVGAMLVFWWRLKLSLKPRPTAAQLRRLNRDEERPQLAEQEEVIEQEEAPLPEDPIEAMEEMQRRRRAAGNGEQSSEELEELRAAVKTRGSGDG